MKARRTLAITKKVLRSLRHDRRTAAFLVLMPIFMIAIFGYTFGGEVEDVEVYVIDLDEGVGPVDLSDLVISHLREDDSLRVVDVVRTGDGIDDPVAYGREKVAEGEAWGCIAFPANFTMDMISFSPGNSTQSEAATVTLFLDGSNYNIAQTVTGAVRSSLSQMLVDDLGIAQPVSVAQDMVYGEGRDFLDTFAPGVISLAVMMVTFMISIISFIHERTTGTLARLLSTPVTEAEVVTGYALAFGLIGLVQSVVVLATALLLFGVQVEVASAGAADGVPAGSGHAGVGFPVVRQRPHRVPGGAVHPHHPVPFHPALRGLLAPGIGAGGPAPDILPSALDLRRGRRTLGDGARLGA